MAKDKPGFTFPGPPPKDALDFFEAKGLKVGFNHLDVWRDEHANSFTVAKAMELDLLKTIKDDATKALAQGKTLAWFKKEMMPKLGKAGWWGEQEMTDPKTGEKSLVQLGSPRRLKTIYQTNMRTARAAGQWKRFERNQKTHPYLLYSLGPSQNHRKEHVAFKGLVLPVSHSFWQTHTPPNGWGCKCRLRAITGREMERLGGVSKAPKIERRDWINRRTGKKIQVPVGIDPGWDTNPGQERRTAVLNTMIDKLNDATPKTALATVKSMVDSPAYKTWLAKPQAHFPVGVLSDDIAKAIKAKQPVVALSRDTLEKQLVRHPELTDKDYIMLPEVIEKGRLVQHKGRNALLLYSNNQSYVVVVKSAETANEVYLSSFYRVNNKEAKRL
ncbi:MAG: head morphogenesis protein, partial [Magnetococcales bacterium]|nr:head morphogenesis protein [Magnetococcales bacterium]